MKWSTIRTSDVRMIYPDTLSEVARRTLCYILVDQPSVRYGFTYGPMRIPFVLHPENFRSNGLVMFLPKRVEFLTSPAISGYSMPWYKQLAAHEYRHAVQYNNLNRGVIRVLSYIFGQQGSTVGLLCMPVWAMEGDAVMSETMASTFGRGLQPSFSMAYRAMGRVGDDRRNLDRWFCGSYRDNIPDHYQLGYQICSYAYDRYGEVVWNKVARFGSRNPYLIATTRIGLGKYYHTNAQRLFHDTFEALSRHWDSLPERHDSALPLTPPLPEKNYTVYQWPIALGDTAVLALKTDLDRPTRFVRIDRRTGAEKRVAYTGQISTRPIVAGGMAWWTEYRRSKFFEQRVNSQLCCLNLTTGRTRREGPLRNLLYPTAAGDEMAWVEYNPDGRYTVVRTDGSQPERIEIPDRKEIHGLAWDDVTKALYVLVTDDSGMWIGRIDGKVLNPITQGAYVTLSNLRAGGGRLYFGSIASGYDEVHGYNLTTGREYRLTTSAFGSFDGAPTREGVVLTTYDRRGYRVALQSDSTAVKEPIVWSKTPLNVVNPPRNRWPVINLDTVDYTAADSVVQSSRYRAHRYAKVPNLVNVHSWMPLAFDPFKAVEEHQIEVNAGFTLISQNLLSNTEAFASYGWNLAEGSMLNAGVRYFGLGLYFDLDLSYGGNQLFYSLASYNEQGEPVYQSRPAPDKYYSYTISTTLPLYFQGGYRNRMFSLSGSWNYSNGMVADLDQIEWKNNSITNIQHVGFKKGLHKISIGASFSDQVRLAHRDFAPRWGYLLSAMYAFNPANRVFSDLISLYGQSYLPGFVLHHSFRVAVNYQTSLGGYKFPSGYAPLTYKSTRLIPHGFTSGDIASNNYLAGSLNYQLPLCYPEGGIGSVLYFKRIRLNLGGDYARFRRPLSGKMKEKRIWAWGGDIVFDINAFRQPASATSTLKFSLYHPSKGGVWYGFSYGLPF